MNASVVCKLKVCVGGLYIFFLFVCKCIIEEGKGEEKRQQESKEVVSTLDSYFLNNNKITES